ncbi:polyprenyl synthetase family protein [Rhabdothermincola sp.]|uniref:polyprenyl synthetase family protein n=1 Tax=Rhabdothermincola sp. TaxID=2820405 RepID=UPI002FE2BAD7
MATPSPLLRLPVLQADLARVEEELVASVRSEDPFLTEVASHLIRAGGKRVRPAFTVTAAGIRGPQLEPAAQEVILGAVSVELVHLGSLYHDDVMDDATTRRTVESVNARWGNLKAILAGDYLLAKASEIAASLGTEVAGLLASTIGRLCEGQVLELQHTFDVARTETAYLASIEGKTASLLATACRVGGLVAGLPRDDVEHLTSFGRDFGMAFQIVDDVLDVVATDEELGKPAGHDLLEGVYTLPVIRTLAEGGRAASRLGQLLGRPLAPSDLATARELVRSNGAVDGALGTARRYVESALGALEPFGASESAEALGAAARHLLDSVAAIAS